MSYFDDYEDDYFSDLDRWMHRQEQLVRHDITCNRCGATGLHWTDDGRRWRLAAPGGGLHVCSNDNTIDDFEVIGS